VAAFDVDVEGDGVASTWIGVGPEGEIPHEAQFRGPACASGQRHRQRSVEGGRAGDGDRTRMASLEAA
jgi:hypothetical protein